MFIYTFGATIVVVSIVVAVNFLLRRRTVQAEKKAVIITGCDQGFGFLTAVRLAQQGYRVFAGCLDAASPGAAALRKAAPNIVTLQLDVTSDLQVAEVRAFIDGNLHGDVLWAVVNNAGVAAFAEAEWCSLAQYQRMMDVNWMGTVRVTKAFLPLLRAARGRLVNIASLAGRVAIPGFTSYAASKFAVVGFSESLRREMVKFGVRVVTVEPTLYKTALTDREALTRQNAQMWAEAPEEVRQQYGETYFRTYLSRLAQHLQFSSEKTHEVVDDVTHAVTSALPYTRYVPGLFANQLPSDFFALTPNLFQDFVLARIFRVPARPASLSKRLREKGKKSP